MNELLQQFWALPVSLLEQCGVVLKDGSVVVLPNTHPDPLHNFQMTAESLAVYGEDIVAFWHTHPDGNANLSDTDYQNFLQFPDQLHYIVTQTRICEYNVLDNLVYIRNVYERGDFSFP